jgi:hypothetical protein
MAMMLCVIARAYKLAAFAMFLQPDTNPGSDARSSALTRQASPRCSLSPAVTEVHRVGSSTPICHFADGWNRAPCVESPDARG